MFLTSNIIADFLLICIVGVMVWHTIYLRKRGRWMAVDPLNAFWGGVLVCYVGQPISNYATLTQWHSEGVINQTLFWILFALGFVVWGYESRLGVKWGNKLPRFPYQLGSNRHWAAAFGLIGLGFLGYAIIMGTAGGFTNWIKVGRGATNYGELNGYNTQLESALPFGVLLLLLRAEMDRSIAPLRLLIWGAGSVMWLWFLYLGSRSRMLSFAMTMAAVYYLPRRKNPPLVLLGAAAAFLLMLATFQGYYRGQFTDLSLHLDSLDWDKAKAKVLPGFLSGVDASQDPRNSAAKGLEFNVTATVIELVPSHTGFNMGYPLLQFFTQPIPHAWWPDKVYPLIESQYPIMSEGDLARTPLVTPHGTFLTGPAFTFVGFWYHAGGPLALIIAGYLTGAFLRMIRQIYDRDPGNMGDILAYICMLPIGFGEAAATPTGWVYGFGIQLIPVLLIIRYSGKLKPRGSLAGEGPGLDLAMDGAGALQG